MKTIMRRKFKSITTPSICWAINAEALSRVFHMEDVEEIHRTILDEITVALDLVAPLQQVQVKERRTPLYLAADTLTLMRRRDAAAAAKDHVTYRKLRNKTAKFVRRDKLESNARHLQAQGFDSKAIWHLANSVSGRAEASALPADLLDESTGEKITGEDRLADCVNNFYIEKIDKIRARIGAHEQQVSREQQQQRRQRHQRQFQFRAPTEGEVASVIMSLNNTKALGVDGIPVAVLKHLAPIIAAPMSHMIGKSFEQSVVPSGFKRASIIPLYKKGKPSNLPSSYRPVAILAAMSKVMEKVVLRQVSPHLAPLLPQEQFGFRPRRSTSAAIAYAHGSWAAARAKGLVVAVAGYDLSSAFDTIDVKMVSSKLHELGVQGRGNEWFYNYLTNRQQQVQYNGGRSTFLPVKYGVPQGSILGPLLFLVLVADLPSRIGGSSSGGGGGSSSGRDNTLEVGFSAYADDALCWVAGKTPEEVGTKLEELSDIIVSYTSENFLALNESKTQVLWCSKRSFPIKVGSSVVEPAQKIDVLGVSFDKVLSPLPYMNSLISSTKSMTAIARRLALHLPTGVLKTVMGSLYRGKIGYASLVLKPRLKDSDPTSTVMTQLQVCINDLARATIRASRRDKLRVEDLLQEAGFNSLNRMIVYSIAMECWRAGNLRDVPDGPLNPLGAILFPPSHSNPNSNSNFKSSPTPGYNTTTRSATQGRLPPPTKVQTDTFIWWAYTCWNASPSLRSAANVSAAKKAANELAASAPF